MSKNQLPLLSERLGESVVRKAQKRRGFNKVPDFLHVLAQPSKRMQRITSSKIQHVHSCLSSSVVACPTHTLLGTSGAGSIQEQQGVSRENTGNAESPFQAGLAGFKPLPGMKKAGPAAVAAPPPRPGQHQPGEASRRPDQASQHMAHFRGRQGEQQDRWGGVAVNCWDSRGKPLGTELCHLGLDTVSLLETGDLLIGDTRRSASSGEQEKENHS